MSTDKTIRVLVADDSATQRKLLASLLRADPDIDEVIEAVDGREAVAEARRRSPDVIVMDVSMPHLDGLAATKQIMIESPTPIVLVSGLDVQAVRISMRALNVGALTVLQKPPTPSSPRFESEVKRFVSTIKALSRVRVVRHWPARRGEDGTAPLHPSEPRRPIVAIAASTGGPPALFRLLGMLPAQFPAPILLVQHIAPGFTSGFVEWLNTAGPLHVKLAEDGERLAPQTVHVAPDDRHLGLRDFATIKLDDGPPMDTFRPSASFLYESVAAAAGPDAIAVILTGMGRDGARGLECIHRAGGRVIAQDEDSSLVFGMPQAAILAGVAHMVLPLESIAAKLVALVSE